MTGAIDGSRSLAYAVIASLLLHAALLSVRFHVLRERTAASPPLTARLVEPAPELAPLPPEYEERSAVREAQRKPKPLVTAKAKREPAPVPPPREEAPAPAPEPSAPVEPSAPAQAQAPVLTATAPAAAAVADAAAIARYRQTLIGMAVRYKRYPPQAVDNGWEGDVLVHIAIAPSGEAGISVKRTSGHELLDAQALEMFRRAAPQVPVPAALRGREFDLEVRAVYRLTDQ
jgi:protein TonB